MFRALQQFAFGEIAMSCISSPLLSHGLSVKRVAYVPLLLDAMQVDLVAAYLIQFCVGHPIHDFAFDFVLLNCDEKGCSSSGESLDAMSWPLRDGRIMIGTEDGDALKARMPWLKTSGESYPVEYLPDGFRVVIAYVAPNTRVAFHFVVAYSEIDTGSDAEWFAVDVPHHRLAELPVVAQIT